MADVKLDKDLISDVRSGKLNKTDALCIQAIRLNDKLLEILSSKKNEEGETINFISREGG